MAANETPPKVFISYSQESPAHEDRVLAFSNRLRADGIDCILDQYEISPPEGWPRWMDRQIQKADFVLLICTQTYFRRVMGQEQPGKGLGVTWESTLIYQYIFNAGTQNIKFIPVLFEGADVSDIPTPLQGASYYSAFTEDGYKNLCQRLRNLPRAVKPPLGEKAAPGTVQQLPPRERAHSFSREAQNEQRKAADFLNIINTYHSELAGTQAFLLNTRNNLGKVRDIDSRQLTEILNRVHKSSVSVQGFYQSVEKLTEQLHSSSSSRHELLVALHRVDKQLSEYLLPALTIFRDLSRTASNRQIMSQRQNVLKQLDKVIDNLREANAVVNKFIGSVPKGEKSELGDKNTMQDETQSSLDQQKTVQSLEQTDNSRNASSDNNRSANHDSDKTQTATDPEQMFTNPSDLRIAMHKALNQTEFKLLCANLKVSHDDLSYDDLEGETLGLKMQSLIEYFSRRKQYKELVRKVLQFRPDLATSEDS